MQGSRARTASGGVARGGSRSGARRRAQRGRAARTARTARARPHPAAGGRCEQHRALPGPPLAGRPTAGSAWAGAASLLPAALRAPAQHASSEGMTACHRPRGAARFFSPRPNKDFMVFCFVLFFPKRPFFARLLPAAACSLGRAVPFACSALRPPRVQHGAAAPARSCTAGAARGTPLRRDTPV